MLKKLLLLSGLSCFAFLNLQAHSIEAGKVYKFNNIGHPGNSLSISSSIQGAVGASSNDADLKQQWYIVANEENTGFYLRNVSNGAYLTSPRAIYTQWPMVFSMEPDDERMLMTFIDVDDNLAIRPLTHTNSGYAYAHNDGSNNIVCWVNSSAASQWTSQEIPMTSEQLESMLERFRQTGDEIAKAQEYEKYLDELFTDKACTNLKVTGGLESNNNYLSLPATLRNMVDKVMANEWSETAGDWDSAHARKYRIQSYEPFSEGANAASMAGIQAYTNMNNPTGIIANSGDILYVMVNDDVPEGATLYIGGVPDCNMYNNATAGTKLHKGLNMVMCNADLTHYFIYYTVNTAENKQPVRSLKNYSPVTIHIEGGQINGFFNYVGDELYSPDTMEDFEYTTSRALHPMYDLIGKYVILHFFLEDTPDLPGQSKKYACVKNAFKSEVNPSAKHSDPVVTMTAWDDMCFAERILMGIQSDDDILNPFNQGLYETIVNDSYSQGEYSINPGFQYSDYFNNRMMGISMQAQGLYMNATAWRTAYAPSTVAVILAQFPEDGIWGPAHEYGHINQTPMRIAGTTEESNNVFSNVANYYVCKTTSRCDYPSEQLKNFNAGNTYLENGTWGTTRMFWQLWCYYHAAGHNKKFYPRLYELLRKYPLKRDLTSIPGKLNPKTDMLHFAKMCCVAAGEDLTNFFTSWGFFVPLDNYHIDDYDVYDCVLTQEDIDEVKSEIAAFGLPVNNAIILIDDRPGSSLPTGFGYNKDLCGQYGGINDFKIPSPPSGEFSFSVDGNKVTVSVNGNPGVGFLVFDLEGNLLGFSNSNTFTLSPEAAAALVNGEAVLKAIGSDNSTVNVTDPVRDGSIETKKELLSELISRCETLLASADETLTHVGSLIPEYCKDLKAATLAASEVLQQSVDGDRLTEEYLTLYQKYYSLLNDESARIRVIPGGAYRLINNYYTNRTLDEGEENLISSTIKTDQEELPLSQQWYFMPVNEEDNSMYYIMNIADGRYVSTTKKQSTSIPMSNDPQPYKLVKIDNGIYSFAPDNDLRFGIHIDASNHVVQWNTSALASQWRMVLTKSPEIPVESIILTPEEITVPLNDEIFRLEATVLPENATNPVLSWSSSDISVLEIDMESGEINLIGIGTAEVTASSTDGSNVQGKCIVTVTGTSEIESIFGTKEETIDVYDLSGQIVKKNVSYENLKAIPKGIYIVRYGNQSKVIMMDK